MNINTLTDKETQLLLRFTRAAVDAVAKKDAPVEFNFEMDDQTSLRQATAQANELADRRRNGRGGRSMVDDQETASIRADLKAWMRRTGRLKKYGVDEENY